MPKRTERVRPPEERALQWQDMPSSAQQGLSQQMVGLGMSRSTVGQQREKLVRARDTLGNAPLTVTKSGQRLVSLAALAPHFKDKPITHSGAASRRVGLVERGGQRTLREGTDPGHDWYFQHNRKLDLVAHTTGHSKAAVVAASAVMSPQNNPEQELTAVTALANAHANPQAHITVSEETARRDPSFADHVGRARHPSEFSAEQLASLSEVGIRGTVQTSGVNLDAISKGGVKANVAKAVDVLRGNVAPHQAINPKSSPKVWSYHNNISKSEWGSPEHEEFVRRMRVATSTADIGELGGQQSFGPMYPDLRTATHGPLDPMGHTAEDTWQQAISTGQRLEKVEVPGRTGRARHQSPAKFAVGEGGSANQKGLSRRLPGMVGAGQSALMHAWQNRATQRAAAILSRRSGEIIPATGVQAGGWTEARRQAGKAIEEQSAVNHAPVHDQGEMFTSSMKVTSRARIPVEYQAEPRSQVRRREREIPGQEQLF